MSLEHRGDVGALVHVAEHLLELEDGLRRAHKVEVYDGGLALEHVRDVGVREERGEFARPRRHDVDAREGIVGSAERDEPLDVQFANAMALGRVVPIAPETDHVHLPLLREAEDVELVVGVASLPRRGRANRRRTSPRERERAFPNGGWDATKDPSGGVPRRARSDETAAGRRVGRRAETKRRAGNHPRVSRGVGARPCLNPEHVSIGKLLLLQPIFFFAREKEFDSAGTTSIRPIPRSRQTIDDERARNDDLVVRLCMHLALADNVADTRCTSPRHTPRSP